MVKIGRLWGDAEFTSLSPHDKLIYIYLISQPSITTLGVINLNRDRILLDTGIEERELNWALSNLLNKGYIHCDEWEGDTLVCIIKEHYLSLSKSKLNLRKATEEGRSSKYKDLLGQIYRPEDFIDGSFVPPTAEEVSEYALSLGHLVNGNTFVNHYESLDWFDARNKKVRSWKAKVRNVWCKEETKLTLNKDAPEGYGYFYVELVDGERISPAGWKEGKPTHGNFMYDRELKKEYERICLEKQQRNI